MSEERARHERVSELFAEVFDLPADEQRAHLESAAAGDPDVVNEVRRLLQDSLSDDMLSDESVDSGRQFAEAAGAAAPDEIGTYRVIRTIGEGGMGVVYEAEQESPRRRVAVKLIRPGLAGKHLLRRFHLEAEVLGRLQHPGIARIYDAGRIRRHGVEQPYFAMELIEGEPLKAWRRGRAAREVMALIARVADAVHHAHQKGVIHRDLKPDNVLVVEDEIGAPGQPKILDFGIARATDADVAATTATDAGQLIGTIAYMSPEQAAGSSDIDVRTDVYAIGVIAYELLAGRAPIDLSKTSLAEAARRIAESTPARLGTVSSSLRGDVETIIARALEKDPERRYQSAAELASDIRRYLADEPILARPPSAVYQLSRFARRHRGLVWGVAATIIVLIGGVAATAWQAYSATKGWGLATRRADELEVTSAFQESMLRDLDAYAFGVALRRHLREAAEAEGAISLDEFLERLNTTDVGVALLEEQILERSAAAINRDFADQPEIAASLTRGVAGVYDDLAASRKAIEVWSSVLARAERAHGADSAQAIEALERVGSAHRQLGEVDLAQALLEDAEGRALRSVGPDGRATLSVRHSLGLLWLDRGDYERAESLTRDVYERRAAVLGENDEATLASGLQLCDALQSLDRIDEAATIAEALLSQAEASYGPAGNAALDAVLVLGKIRLRQQRVPDAIDLLRRLLEGNESRLGSWHRATITAQQHLAQALREGGETDEASVLLETAYERSREALGVEHLNTLNVMNDLATLYQDVGRLDEAERLGVEALAIKRRVIGVNHPHTLIAANNLGMLYRELGRWSDAATLLEDTYERRKLAIGESHTFTLVTGFNAADSLLKCDEAAACEAMIVDIVERAESEFGSDHVYTAIFRSLHGQALAALKRFSEAEVELLAAIEVFVSSGGAPQRFVVEAHDAIISMYSAWGRDADAALWREARNALDG